MLTFGQLPQRSIFDLRERHVFCIGGTLPDSHVFLKAGFFCPFYNIFKKIVVGLARTLHIAKLFPDLFGYGNTLYCGHKCRCHIVNYEDLFNECTSCNGNFTPSPPPARTKGDEWSCVSWYHAVTGESKSSSRPATHPCTVGLDDEKYHILTFFSNRESPA